MFSLILLIIMICMLSEVKREIEKLKRLEERRASRELDRIEKLVDEYKRTLEQIYRGK